MSTYNIKDQRVSGNGNSIINCGKYENHYYDDMLDYYFKREIQINEDLKCYYDIIMQIINKDMLKMRLGSIDIDSKYNELAKLASDVVSEKRIDELVPSNRLDDGYKSIISCILNIALLFNKVQRIEEDECLQIKGEDKIIAKVRSATLKFEFLSEKISSAIEYRALKKNADDLEKKVSVFLYCVKSYGNFLKFNNVCVEPSEDLNFVDKEVKFNVSPSIIPSLIEPLYGDKPEFGARELIQNAADACKERILRDPNKDYKSKAKIEIYIIREKDIYLVIKDNGIGMNESILTDKFLVIGESTKKSLNNIYTGKFGVGVLASFLLGNKIHVKTKHINSKEFLTFTAYEYNEDTSDIINISKIKDTEKDCGTEIKIRLKKSLAELNDSQLIKKLRLKEWFLTEEVKIEVMNKVVPSVRKENYDWRKLSISKSNFQIEYLYTIYKNVKSDESITYNEYDVNGQIICNGILIPNKYKLDSKYIINNPALIIIDRDNKLKIDLSRKSVDDISCFRKELINQLYKDSFAELNLLREKVCHSNSIKTNKFSNGSISNIKLVFSKDGFGLLSRAVLEYLKSKEYKYIINIYNCSEYQNTLFDKNYLQEGYVYIFHYGELNKSGIADVIENSYLGVYMLSDIVKRYGINENNSTYGFRKDSILKLYDHAYVKTKEEQYKKVYDTLKNKKSTEIWEEHNKIKNLLEEAVLGEDIYSISKLNDLNVKIIYNFQSNAIVTVESIDTFVQYKCFEYEEVYKERLNQGQDIVFSFS
ncbi:MAG: ATP-binding protein [Clostridiaceae bacterium]|nr:ATP-binding protein [Clostridiaceae bacterium]